MTSPSSRQTCSSTPERICISRTAACPGVNSGGLCKSDSGIQRKRDGGSSISASALSLSCSSQDQIIAHPPFQTT
ncbi:hypothetical protein D9M70_377420 [compost metagenome]